ncbi:MAG TPA: FtsX-like permease family protein [Baekduia sp.]
MSVTWEPLPKLPPRSRLRLGSVLALYIVRLRTRWLQELLAAAGIAVGVALLYAGAVANSSLSGPVRQLNQGIVGNAQLQLVARGADGFPDSLYRAVRDTPGVELAAPVLQVPASVIGPGGRRAVTIYASDPRIVHLLGSLVQGFAATDLAKQEVVALSTSTADELRLHTGDLTRFQIAGRTQVVGVVVLGRRDIGGLADTSIALAPMGYLQRLAGLQHRFSRVLVHAAPDRLDEVRGELRRAGGGSVDVRTADYEPRLFDKTSRPTAQATLISSTLSSLVGFMFAACAMLVTVPARRALAVDLRRSGFTNDQIVRVLLVDALVLGVCAVAVGLLLGDALSRRGFSTDAGFLEGAFPIGDERIVTLSSVLIAAAGGLLATTIGVLAPLRTELLGTASGKAGASSAGRRRPTLTPGRVTGLAGAALLATSVAITVLVPGAALVGLIALTLAVPLFVPMALDAAVTFTRWSSRRAPRALMAFELALPQLESPAWRVRSLAIATTGALAVFGAAALHGARVNLQTGLDRAATVEYDHVADVWVSPYGPGDLFAVTSVPPAAARAIAGLPAVQRVRLYRGSYLDVAGNRAWIRAPARDSVRPIPAGQVLDGTPDEATARFRAGGWATVSRALADALHVRIGERFVLPSPFPMPLRVAAITTNLGLPGGALILNADDYAGAWGSAAVSAYQVTLAPGVSPEQGRADIQRALGGHSALRVETATQRDRREMAASRAGLSRLRQVSSLTLLAAIIAMAAAMAGLLWQQRGAVSRQKLDGHSTSVMWRSLAVQSGVLFATGCLVGAGASLLGQILFSRGLQTISGFPVVVGVQLGVAAASFALVTAISLLVVAVPGFFVARVPPSLRTGD